MFLQSSSSSSYDSFEVEINMNDFPPLRRESNNLATRPILRNLRERIGPNYFAPNPFIFYEEPLASENSFLGRRRVVINEGWETELRNNRISLPSEDCEYIDFRYYPIPINWYECDERNFGFGCEILELFGNFGLSLFTKLKNLKNSSDPENFLINVIDYYYNVRFYGKIESVNVFIENLPKIDKIKEILKKRLFNDKDVFPMKIVFDIYENYFKYDTLSYQILQKELYPLVIEFYSNISQDCLEKIYSKIKNCRVSPKKIENILTLFKTKEDYINHFRLQILNHKFLFEGIDKDKFTV